MRPGLSRVSEKNQVQWTPFDLIETLNRENVSFRDRGRFRDRDRKRLTQCHMALENFDAELLLNTRVSI